MISRTHIRQFKNALDEMQVNADIMDAIMLVHNVDSGFSAEYHKESLELVSRAAFRLSVILAGFEFSEQEHAKEQGWDLHN